MKKNWQRFRKGMADMPGSSRSATNRSRQNETRPDPNEAATPQAATPQAATTQTSASEATTTAAPRIPPHRVPHEVYIQELKIKRIRWIQCDWGSGMFDIFPVPLLKSEAYLPNGLIDASVLRSVSQLTILTSSKVLYANQICLN